MHPSKYKVSNGSHVSFQASRSGAAEIAVGIIERGGKARIWRPAWGAGNGVLVVAGMSRSQIEGKIIGLDNKHTPVPPSDPGGGLPVSRAA